MECSRQHAKYQKGRRTTFMNQSPFLYFLSLVAFGFVPLKADENTHIPQQLILMVTMQLMANHMPASIKD